MDLNIINIRYVLSIVSSIFHSCIWNASIFVVALSWLGFVKCIGCSGLHSLCRLVFSSKTWKGERFWYVLYVLSYILPCFASCIFMTVTDDVELRLIENYFYILCMQNSNVYNFKNPWYYKIKYYLIKSQITCGHVTV